MKNNDSKYSFLSHWLESTLLGVDGVLEVNDDWTRCEQLHSIRETMVSVARSRGALFKGKEMKGRIRPTLECTPLGRKLRDCMKADLEGLAKCFAGHRLDPYFTLLRETVRSSSHAFRASVNPTAENLNLFVEELRRGANAANFRRRLDAHVSNARRNAASGLQYVDSLFARHSRLLVVRLDLHYDRALMVANGLGISEEELPQHREKLIRYVREGMPAYVGYLWCIEWGERKGPHYHVILFFKGDRVRQGISIAQQVGEHWKNVVTDGRGGFFNGNLREGSFEARGLRGIGMISHADDQRRANLNNVITYLAKVDLYVRLEIPGMKKTFGHGQLKPHTSNAGRKRKLRRPGLVMSLDARRRLLTRRLPKPGRGLR